MAEITNSPLPEKAEQILRAAVPEFLANGYARTSMDRMAKVAGTSKQTLYSHFTIFWDDF